MGTLQGALVLIRDVDAFSREMEAHNVALLRPPAPGWAFVESAPQLGNLGTLPFSKELSLTLQTEVIDIAIQTTASVEEILHFEGGALQRRLVYEGDGGGWIVQEGRPQAWEPAYFFPAGEGTSESEEWPGNLPDEVSDDDIARYNEAKKMGDASPVLDLLSGGSIWPLLRLFEHYGVDDRAPVARYQPPPSRRPVLWALAFFIALLGAIVLGALFPKP